MAGENVKNFREQGGDDMVIGGTLYVDGALVVRSGGALDMKTGSTVKTNGTQAAAIPDVAMTVGTPDGTLADVGVAFNQATLNNNFADLGTKVNAILAVLRAKGDIASS